MKRTKLFFKLNYLIVFILLIDACGTPNRTDEFEETSEHDSIGMHENFDSLGTPEPLHIDTAVSVPDSLILSPIEVNPTVKSAELGYSYPPSLTRREIGDINVQVEIKNPNSTLRDQLTDILISQSSDFNPKGDSIVIYSESIPFYRELDISLSDDAKDFEILAKHLNNIQSIDSISGNNWHWTIIPISDKKKAQLMLKIVATDIKGNSKVFEPKRIYISIKLDNESCFRRLINYLSENPAVSIPILISFFGFIGFIIRQVLLKKNPEV